jgi:tetratricopeptide (TPR) repeat protein
MFRRLTAALRHWRFVLRDWAYALRDGVSAIPRGLLEWYAVLTAPVRNFSPRQLGSELAVGGREALGMARGFLAILAGLAHGFVWLIVAIPRYVVFAAVHGPRWVWFYLRDCTPRQLAVVGVLTVIVGVGLIGAPGYLFWEWRREGKRALYWRQYEAYLGGGDVEKLESTVTALQKVSPADPALGQIAAAIRDRSAPAGDPKLVRFVVRVLLQEKQFSRAAAEARKLLESLPDDWEAHYILAEEAAQRGDLAAARKELAVPPRALDVAETVPPYVALYAARLCRRLGDTARYDELIEFTFLNLLPALKSKDVEHLESGYKLLLIQAYHQALAQLDRRPRLTQYMAPVQQACRMILEDPAVNVPMLVELGHYQEQDLQILQEFLRRNLITEDQCKGMTADVEGRLKALWEALIAREPQNPLGYTGLAYHQQRTGDAAAAVRAAARGLEACGPKPEMVAAMAKILLVSDPPAGLAFLEGTLRESDLTPAMCQVYADVALRAGRRDKALEACRRALQQDPNLPWAHYREGEICLELGRPTEAAAALTPIKAELAKDPAGSATYVRALCECGSYQLAEEFLEQVSAENQPVEVLLQAAKGLESARRPADAVRWAKRVLEKDPLNVHALLIAADGLRVLAEVGDRDWDIEKVREALRDYRAVQRQLPKNLIVVNNIVWLELKALGLKREAFESAEPLRAVQNEVGIPADFLETLGAVYIGVGQYEQAKQVLKQAIATAGPRPSFYMHLALAHDGLKQPQMTARCLQQAAELPGKSPRELAELYDLIKSLGGK